VTFAWLGALACAFTMLESGGARSAAPDASWADARVRVTGGAIQGALEGVARDVRSFKGIPYAAPPVGHLRWRPPDPVAPWNGSRSARHFGHACPQAFPELMTEPVASTGEDCLTLNVWTAAARHDERRPVMVWIHGGAYVQGASSIRHYDGERLARRARVVVVSLNYRLGPFGFFAHRVLSAESGRGVSGNQGLRDVIQALHWVQENAAAFGGDATRVTVFGQSSGAGVVNALLTAPAAGSLFHRAILESGTVLGPIQHLRQTWYLLPSGEAIGARVQAAARFDAAAPLALMRALPTEGVQVAAEAQKPFTATGNRYAPIVDGDVLPEEPVAAMEAGRFAHVPIVVGANEDEGTLFKPLFGTTTAFTYAQLCAFAYGTHARDVLRLFPATSDADAPDAFARSLGAAAFVAPARRLARLAARHGVPAYLYHFTKRRPGDVGQRMGAFHGAEIPYVFGNLVERQVPGLGRIGVDARDTELSEQVIGYWARFAATGDPNGGGAPSWPKVDDRRTPVLELGAGTLVRDGVQVEACDVFDASFADWRKRRN
jgi:para-nitrobenzyl esterase